MINVIDVTPATHFFFLVVEDSVEDVYDVLIDFAGQYIIDVFSILYLDVLIAACHIGAQ